MIDLNNHICICEENCVVNSTQTIHSVWGTKTNYIAKNTEQNSISKYIIDDCVLTTFVKDEKCDYLFLNKNKKYIYFIELKGSDVKKAIKQIDSSLSKINRPNDYKIFARIIPTKSPTPALYSQQLKKLNKKLFANIIIKSTKYQEEI